jgi:HSP20 family protein
MSRYIIRPVRQTYPLWQNGAFSDPFFNEALNIFLGDRPAKTNGNGNNDKAYYSPRLNLVEDQNNFYVYLMLPGMNPDKLDVTVQENKLTVKGESEGAVFGPQAPAEGEEQPKYRWLLRELPVSPVSFQREVELPLAVDAEQVQATYDNGILRLLLPKAASVKPRKVTVQSAS